MKGNDARIIALGFLIDLVGKPTITQVRQSYFPSHRHALNHNDQVYEFFLADLRQLRLFEVGWRAGGGRRAQPLRRVGKEQSSAGGGLEPNRAGRGAMLRGGAMQR